MVINSYISLFVFLFVIISILLSFRSKKSFEIKKRKIKFDYAIIPTIGVIILILTFSINPEILIKGIIGSERIRPYSIIIIFFSVAYICLSLDLTGFFEFISLKTIKTAKNSGIRLFIYLFFLSSILTIFTSNDIVILTLTPIIIYFSKYTKINPIPYLIAQFFAANIWSLTLYIGNPTNIIVAEAFNLSFLDYSIYMLLPTIIGGLSCLSLLILLFKKKIKTKYITPEIDPKNAIKDKSGAIFGIIILFSCIIALALSSSLNYPLWVISSFFAIILFLKNLLVDIISHKNFTRSKKILNLVPWKILPFIIGMFIIVETLVEYKWIDSLAVILSKLNIYLLISIIFFTFISALMCNLMNNQPMTIFFTQILLNESFTISGGLQLGIIYSLIMGSNFGANFTFIGALAGIMWYKILLNKGIHLRFNEFAKYGFFVMPIVIFFSSITLFIEITFIM
ncbi:MAG: hypothetical protein JXA99_16160 [Candidatus Lokiarchaeota archaeon]|nr:hypothetical protein [Candidatus Lokiarchaeota archaeon]